MALVPIHRRVTHFWPAFFGGVFLFSAFAALVIIVYNASMPKESVEKARADARVQKLAALRADDHVKLSAYKWVNKQKGTVQIPIALAMKLVLVDLKKKTPHASNVKVENPYPAGLQDLVVAAAPAVSGSSATLSTPLAIPASSKIPVVNSAATPAPSPTPGLSALENGKPPIQLTRPLASPIASPTPAATAPPNPTPAASVSPKPTIHQPLWNWQSPVPASSPVLKQ